MLCKVEAGRVVRGPQTHKIGNEGWLPYEEVFDGPIDHATQQWGSRSFAVLEDKVVGTVRAEAKPAPEPETVIALVTDATQKRLDDFAKTRNYDGILSACTYATSTVPSFAAEGQYCVGARDATWAALYTIMAEVQTGTRPMPTGFADVEADLPALVWP